VPWVDLFGHQRQRLFKKSTRVGEARLAHGAVAETVKSVPRWRTGRRRLLKELIASVDVRVGTSQQVERVRISLGVLQEFAIARPQVGLRMRAFHL
jgi:hypothetical protein